MKSFILHFKQAALPVRIFSAAAAIGGFVFFLMFIPALLARNINTGTVFGFAIGIFTSVIGILTPYLIKAENKIVRYICRTVLTVFCLLVVYAAVLSGLMLSAMTNTPPSDSKSTVIVLGCQVNSSGPSLMLKNRLEAAYSYLSENPEAQCIVAGGKGDNEHISEAEAMYNWLVDRGIEKSRITKEPNSSSTLENLKFSKEILSAQGKELNAILVTDGFHQYRAGLQAKSLGFKVNSISSATPIYLLPAYWVREWFAISYQLTFGADTQRNVGDKYN